VKRKFLILILIGVMILAGVSFFFPKNNQPNNSSSIILFYGTGCPHCAKVEEFIKENKIREKISFQEKEVYFNKNNANELAQKAKECGLPTDEIGVPLLWDGSKCFIGETEIINFFEEKI